MNKDCFTGTIECDNLCIENGGCVFENYPGDEAENNYKYKLKRFKEDHKLYNKFLDIVNRAKSDLIDQAMVSKEE